MPATLLRLAATSTAAALAAGAFTVLTATSAAADAGPAADYLRILNHERVDHGLPRLTARPGLDAVARHWAHRMASATTLAHNPNLTTQVSNWRIVGENVGEGPTIAALADAFWASPEHRANILDPVYRDVGVGAVKRNGIIWITVDFRTPMHPPVTRHRSVARHRPMARQHRGSSRGESFVAVHRTLRPGMTGRDVAKVQRHLHVADDGIFGPVTRRAVRHFQHRHGIRPTGVVGFRTWKAITR